MKSTSQSKQPPVGAAHRYVGMSERTDEPEYLQARLPSTAIGETPPLSGLQVVAVVLSCRDREPHLPNVSTTERPMKVQPLVLLLGVLASIPVVSQEKTSVNYAPKP